MGRKNLDPVVLRNEPQLIRFAFVSIPGEHIPRAFANYSGFGWSGVVRKGRPCVDVWRRRRPLDGPWRRVLEKAIQTKVRRRVDLFRNGLPPEPEPRANYPLRNGSETGRAEHVSKHYRIRIFSNPFRYIRLHPSYWSQTAMKRRLDTVVAGCSGL